MPCKANEFHQHPNTMRYGILARSILEIVPNFDLHLRDLEAVITNLNEDFRTSTHPLRADMDVIDCSFTICPKATLSICDPKLTASHAGGEVQDLHADLAIERNPYSTTLFEPRAYHYIVALPKLSEKSGYIFGIMLAVGINRD